ncbi:hypothetical protein BBJ28_00022006 [Nothophytophthora sp. Chile5]|nr:hypothetical protein BBJ28_00022006 [Nothophytophthora sp. Chile5]
MQMLASREQRKRFVALKQFIADIYETIVGKLKELPPRRLAETVTSRCHLALSFVEWRQQRAQICSRAIAADQPGELLPSPISFSIDELTREHFRCQLGLKQLADAAFANLQESIDAFTAVDPDVKRFHEFLTHERSEEELVFCCVCRYLCVTSLTKDESTSAGSSHRRQPVFHAVTMREVMDVSHALELAKLLFRVEEETAILASDASLIEVENAVYQQYLPTNGYHQFEAIVSSYFVDADASTATTPASKEVLDEEEHGDESISSGNRRPPGSPRHASVLVRPTNCNQFHAKQYNLQAARSPLIRRQQSQRLSQGLPFAACAPTSKWVHFEEVLALLLRYRGEMNHFHLFAYWVQELFSLATSKASATADNGTARSAQAPSNPPKLLDDAAFVETLMPLSLGPTEREFKNIFHNSLRQRRLRLLMPLRVFTSVALLLLRNGLLSVSSYAPLQAKGTRLPSLEDDEKEDRAVIDTRQRTLSIREQDDDRAWRTLALKWRGQEAAFEAAIEAIYHETPSTTSSTADKDARAGEGTNRTALALQLLQLRQELYELFESRSGRGRDLKRAQEVYEILVDERLDRVGGDTNVLDAQLAAWELPSALEPMHSFF